MSRFVGIFGLTAHSFGVQFGMECEGSVSLEVLTGKCVCRKSTTCFLFRLQIWHLRLTYTFDTQIIGIVDHGCDAGFQLFGSTVMSLLILTQLVTYYMQTKIRS